ncbi:tetratricopeptide repeat protein [Streptomyces sp. NPDC058268]|uniref:tetratricopeptide repeat protein n=1 Tax=Streptomyces sp. NPDC058268 TaxID=3346413 RepID=UPI0036E12185
MAVRGHGGRPWGPIRAESAEAETLARFMRAQVDASGKTLAVLAGEIHISKTQISDRLGGRVPDQEFVATLIRATIPEPRLRERRLTEALRRLEAAAHPAPATPPPPVTSAVELAELQAQQVETYKRLTRSLEQQNQLHEALGNSAKLVMVLLTMINKLERRITDLVGEREQLRAAHVAPDTLRQTQQQLARAQEQEQRAQQELLRTQEKQRQAEEVAALVQAQVDQLTDELDRLQGTTTNDTSARNVPSGPPGEPAVTADPIGDDIDQALVRITAVNDQDNQVLRRITHDVLPDPPPERVVRDISPDNLTALREAAQAAADVADQRTAVGLYTALVDAYKRRIGPEHPDTLATRSDLAWWRGKAGDAAGAAAALAGLLPIQERVLGPEHPDTLATRSDLAWWRGKAGDAAGAAAALTELLPIQERVLGPEHPDTLATRNYLAWWRGHAGDAAGAAALAGLLPIWERVLGPEHPGTLATRSDLAWWRGKAGDAAGAATTLTELLPIQERVLGPEHPDTLATNNNLAIWGAKAGDADGIAAALAGLLPIWERVLGPEHPDTLATRNNLAWWQGKGW